MKLHSRQWVEETKRKMNQAKDDWDRHRIHAYAVIDTLLEEGKITPQEAQKRKAMWDKRH